MQSACSVPVVVLHVLFWLLLFLWGILKHLQNKGHENLKMALSEIINGSWRQRLRRSKDSWDVNNHTVLSHLSSNKFRLFPACFCPPQLYLNGFHGRKWMAQGQPCLSGILTHFSTTTPPLAPLTAPNCGPEITVFLNNHQRHHSPSAQGTLGHRLNEFRL